MERRRSHVNALLATSLISAVLAFSALGLVVYSYVVRPSEDATLRARAGEDTCLLLRGLVFAATAKGQLSRAEAYINSTSLRDCVTYGRKIASSP